MAIEPWSRPTCQVAPDVSVVASTSWRGLCGARFVAKTGAWTTTSHEGRWIAGVSGVAIVTQSSITIQRVPIEFLEIELAVLEEMGFQYSRSEEYDARNGHTRLIDIETKPSQLHAPPDKIHPMPFPGLNIDNLPFFAVIAAVADGQTFLHDWVYENRAIYLTELNKLGAQVKLLDPHRVMIEGPTHWTGAELMCPPALRPAVVILLAMLASKGTSVLRGTYVIHRGYEDLAERLSSLGANIETFRDI